jgi:hypothetical protein
VLERPHRVADGLLSRFALDALVGLAAERDEVAVVGKVCADRQVHDPELRVAKGGEEPLLVRDHRAGEAVAEVRPGCGKLLEEDAPEAVVRVRVEILHVDQHERRPCGVERELGPEVRQLLEILPPVRHGSSL